jgi:hydrogenase expression/formation protein HypD
MMRMDLKLRDKKTARKALDTIGSIGESITVMHVCGTHQDTLVRFGIEPLLREVGVTVRQGPGCPVCVTTGNEIESAMELARRGKVVASFGDMIKVPGREGTLSDIRSKGGDVRIIYSPTDVVDMAKREPDKDFIFLGIGFETTAPTTSALLLQEDLPENISIMSFHRTVPPALKAIASAGEIKLDGLIEPGHVSMIIGENPYRFLSTDYGLPQAIAGFEPLDLIMACLEIAKQKKENRADLANLYGRVVRPEGNPRALSAMKETFLETDIQWRGFPVIPASGLAISPKFAERDAYRIYQDELEEVRGMDIPEPAGCRCGEVLRGLIDPKECPLFANGCDPQHPIGPCMVSREGSCNILHRWGVEPV